MKRILLGFCAVFLSLLTHGQERAVVLKGRITDAKQRGISFSGIRNLLSGEGAVADENGYYLLRTRLPAHISAFSLGYKTVETAPSFPPSADTLVLNLILEPDLIQLNEVEVSAKQTPEQLESSPFLQDFEIRNKCVWLLYKNDKGCKLTILDSALSVLTSQPVSPLAEHVSKSAHDFLYIPSPGKDSVHFYTCFEKTISSFALKTSQFLAQVVRVEAYSKPYYYYAYEDPVNADFRHTCYTAQDSLLKTIYTYHNPDMAERNKERVRRLAQMKTVTNTNRVNKFGLSTGAMGENVLDNTHKNTDMTRPYEAASATESSILANYRGICPLLLVRDSIYIFNFETDSIVVFGQNGTKVRQLFFPLNRHGIRSLNRIVMTDEEKKDCYYKYIQNGITHLQKVDLDAGGAMNQQVFKGFPFIEKLRIAGGYAYFTCLEHQQDGSSIRKLRRLKIN